MSLRATIIVSSNLTMATLLCPWKKQFTAISSARFRLVVEMFCASNTDDFEADLHLMRSVHNRKDHRIKNRIQYDVLLLHPPSTSPSKFFFCKTLSAQEIKKINV